MSGFLSCLLGFINQASLAGGLIVLSTAYLFYWITWLGDKHGIWYDAPETGTS